MNQVKQDSPNLDENLVTKVASTVRKDVIKIESEKSLLSTKFHNQFLPI